MLIVAIRVEIRFFFRCAWLSSIIHINEKYKLRLSIRVLNGIIGIFKLILFTYLTSSNGHIPFLILFHFHTNAYLKETHLFPPPLSSCCPTLFAISCLFVSTLVIIYSRSIKSPSYSKLIPFLSYWWLSSLSSKTSTITNCWNHLWNQS